MPPINVMQVVHDLEFGGMQRVVVDLCLRVDPSRFKMRVCCLNGLGANAEELTQAGIPISLVKKGPGLDYSLPIRLRKLFMRERVGIVHTHGINPFFYGTIGARLTGRLVTIQTDHARGLFPVARKEMTSERVLSWFVDRIVAVSEGVRSDLIKYERIDPSKIEVIYNGIDEQRFRTAIDPVKKRAELGIRPEETVIGVGVRLSEQKGISYLIEAAAVLFRDYPTVKLLILGDGELRGSLERLAEERGVREKVLFTGFRSDMGELLQIIDIYALPSLWEGHPLVLLEAMAAGKPVVATDIPGNNEIVQNGRTGLLVPCRNSERLANALGTLAADRELRLSMGAAGYERYLREFRLDRMIRDYEDLYQRCLSG